MFSLLFCALWGVCAISFHFALSFLRFVVFSFFVGVGAWRARRLVVLIARVSVVLFLATPAARALCAFAPGKSLFLC